MGSSGAAAVAGEGSSGTGSAGRVLPPWTSRSAARSGLPGRRCPGPRGECDRARRLRLRLLQRRRDQIAHRPRARREPCDDRGRRPEGLMHPDDQRHGGAVPRARVHDGVAREPDGDV